MTNRSRLGRLTALVLAASLLVSCSDDDPADDATDTPTTTGANTEAPSGSDPAGDPEDPSPRQVLRILVSNDDGFGAEGIDALVEGLYTLENVEITVYAPSQERSGSGGTRTEGDLEVTEATTASGRPVHSVGGYPADAVRVALEDDGLQPHLVVSGINEGQNLGPIIDISGTVGAARVGVANGIPALAVSQGFGETHDYPSAVGVVLDWIRDHTDELLDGTAPVEVVNFNVPSCDTGMIRGLAEVEPDFEVEAGQALLPQDCLSTEVFTPEMGDVAAFNAGFVTESVVPAEPATPVNVMTTTVPMAEAG